MNMLEATKRCKAGRQMARIGWKPGEYIWWNTGYNELWYQSETDANACPYTPSDTERAATDWINVTGLTTEAPSTLGLSGMIRAGVRPSLLEGFRNTPPDITSPRIEIAPKGVDDYTPAQLGTPAQPSFTRYAGDGTWKVVRNGEIHASGFDSESEAAEWMQGNP